MNKPALDPQQLERTSARARMTIGGPVQVVRRPGGSAARSSHVLENGVCATCQPQHKLLAKAPMSEES